MKNKDVWIVKDNNWSSPSVPPVFETKETKSNDKCMFNSRPKQNVDFRNNEEENMLSPSESDEE